MIGVDAIQPAEHHFSRVVTTSSEFWLEPFSEVSEKIVEVRGQTFVVVFLMSYL